MVNYDNLMDQYLEDRGIDSQRTMERSLMAVHALEIRRKTKARWYNLAASGCGLLSIGLLYMTFRQWSYIQFAYLNLQQHGGVRHLGFSQGVGTAPMLLSLSGGILVAMCALALWLPIQVQRWRQARRLAQVETSLPNPKQVLKRKRDMQ